MALPIGRSAQQALGQLRRDLRMVVRDLRGVHDAPFAPRTRDARPPDALPLLAPRRFVVREVVKETPDAVTLWLEGPPVSFVAGQFMTLLVPCDGEILRRAYSIASSPRAPERIALAVKRVQGGRASSRIVDGARVGDAFDALGPSGSFTLAPGDRPLVLVAGGSGITPLMAILREALELEPSRRVRLVYANRGPDDVIFARALDELARAHAERFELRHAFGDRFDPAAIGPIGDALVYSCGPEPMMKLVRAVAPVDRLVEERYGTPHARGERAPRAKRRVVVRMHGAERAIDVPPTSSILEAGLAAGLAMPFSCAMGGCGACRVRIVSGRVETDEASCLTDRERKDGYALACVASPLEDAVVEAP